jgi:hypothetical protein
MPAAVEQAVAPSEPDPEKIAIRTPTRPILHDAAKEGDVELLTRLLDENGSLLHAVHLGHMPLHLSAKGGHTAAIALLLDRGCDVDAHASNGVTALHCAAECNRTEAIALLLDRGAVLQATASKVDTALHYAAFHGRLAAARLLVARGADPHATDVDGYTPRDDAILRGRGRCPCEDPTGREWAAVGAFLGLVEPMAAAERMAIAQRLVERPITAVLHDAAERADRATLRHVLEMGALSLPFDSTALI